MGIKILRLHNKSLLQKCLWRFKTESITNEAPMVVVSGNTIRNQRREFWGSVEIKVGNGRNIKFWGGQLN